jgi:mycoredoxin
MVPYAADIHAAPAERAARGPGTAGAGRTRTEKLLHTTGDPAKQAVRSGDDKEAPVPLTMYTTTWCGFCKNLKRQLGKAGVEVTEVDIEHDPEAAKFVESVNGGNQTVPTLLFDDGSTLCNPSAAQVQQKLAKLAAAQPS